MNARALQSSSWGRWAAATVFLGWIVGGGAYLFYCAFTYRGLVRWVGDWEMRHLGAYAWRATFLAGLVVLILPAYLLVKLLPERRDSSEAVGAPPSAAAPSDPQARAVQVRRAVLWIGLGALLVALTSAFVGYRKLSEPVVFEPFDLSSAAGTPPEHVELSGIAQTAFLVTQRETINGHTTVHTFVPLTGLGWRSTEPVAYFTEPTSTVYVGEHGPVRFDPRTPPFAVRMRGVLFSGALPGTVVAAFENAGLKLAPKTQLLDTRPAAEEEIYFLVATPAGILALLSFGLLAAVRLMRRRARSPGPTRGGG